MAEHFLQGGERVTLKYPPQHTLDEGFAWLKPTFNAARELFPGQDRVIWNSLKLDLSTLAMDWLDCQATAERGLPPVTTWRPGWWDALRVSGNLSMRSIASALTTGDGPRLLKYHGIDPMVRKALIRARKWSRPGRSMSAVLFLAEVATPSMLDSLIGLARPNDQFLSLDAQASMRLRMQGHNAASIPPKLTALRAGRTVRSAIREALSCTDDRFADAVGPGLARLFSQLRSDGAHIKRSLERGNTSLIVLASDQHRYGNLIAEIARPYDIKTLVIQHGLPQSPVGFLPARADHYAVFGRTSAQFFHAAGVARERVHLVGLPRPSAETTSGTRDSILVPLQPGPEAANRAILRTIEEFQRSRLNVRTILRVHPGDRRTLALPNADVVAYWAPALRDVTVDRDRDATSTFARTRLLLTANSTLAVDAAAAGVPVAAFRSASLDDSPFFEGLPEVQDAASLGEALDSATSLNNSALLHATHEEAIALGRNLLDDLSR